VSVRTDDARVRAAWTSSSSSSFRRADRDGSGTIDSGELASILKDAGIELEPRMMERLMLKMDRNGDGVVSYEEFMLALRVGPHGNRQKRLLPMPMPIPVPMPTEAHPGMPAPGAAACLYRWLITSRPRGPRRRERQGGSAAGPRGGAAVHAQRPRDVATAHSLGARQTLCAARASRADDGGVSASASAAADDDGQHHHAKTCTAHGCLCNTRRAFCRRRRGRGGVRVAQRLKLLLLLLRRRRAIDEQREKGGGAWHMYIYVHVCRCEYACMYRLPSVHYHRMDDAAGPSALT
jgi:hypothetical protein